MRALPGGGGQRRRLVPDAMPWVDFAVCPAEETGCNPGEWFRTPEGRAVVLGEVRRLGSQINRQLEELMADERSPEA